MVVGWDYGLRPLGFEEIDRLLVPSGKAYTLLTGHLITGKLLRSEPAQERWCKAKPSVLISRSGLLGWL